MSETESPNDKVMQRITSRRSRVIGAVRSPLGFFALSLLIVEGFLLGAGIFFALSPELRVVMIAVGVLLFLLVFLSVFWLVVKHPTNLVFSEHTHLEYAAMQIFGTKEVPLTGAKLEALDAVEVIPAPSDRQLQAPSEGE